MTIAELNEVRDLREKLRAAIRQLRALRESIQNLCPELDGMPHAQSQQSKVEKMTVLIIEGEREVDALKAQIDTTGAALARKIKNLPLNPQEQEILILRYVGCLSFRDIKAKLHMSEPRVFFHHRAAFKKIKLDDSHPIVTRQLHDSCALCYS